MDIERIDITSSQEKGYHTMNDFYRKMYEPQNLEHVILTYKVENLNMSELSTDYFPNQNTFELGAQ